MIDERTEWITVHGVRIPLDREIISDKIEERLREGKYERKEARLLRRILKRGDRVLDLGACLGVTATTAARVRGVAGVMAFEANPRLIPFLERVFRENEVPVDLRHGILDAKGLTGETPFFLNQHVWGSTRKEHPGRTKVMVPVHDLRALLDSYRPTVLSCDIEGSEVALLVDVPLPSVRTIVIEMHPKIVGPKRVERLRDHFAAEGFEKSDLAPEGQVEVWTRVAA